MKNIKTVLEEKGITGEFASKLIEANEIFFEIYEECGRSFIEGDGSYLFEGGVYEYCAGMYPKQELLYNLAKESKSTLEIGTYMGHSLLIMLLGNPELKITSIDLVDKYALPSINVLRKRFPKSEIEFIHGDSLKVLPGITTPKFDLFHIDGHHLEEHIRQEVEHCKRLSTHNVYGKDAARIVFDDIHCCKMLVFEIVANKEVLQYINPDCIWTNAYVEFYL